MQVVVKDPPLRHHVDGSVLFGHMRALLRSGYPTTAPPASTASVLRPRSSFMKPQPVPSQSPQPSPWEFWMIQYLSGGWMPLLGQPTGSTPHPTSVTAWFVSWLVHLPLASATLPLPVTHLRSVRTPLHVSALPGYVEKRLSTCT